MNTYWHGKKFVVDNLKLDLKKQCVLNGFFVVNKCVYIYNKKRTVQLA